ncbi:MAG: amidohydrolase family protein [Verrucomicrobia bacterium]|nr:amidohydrolase family protein [Verrucomicrobiota bacterium]
MSPIDLHVHIIGNGLSGSGCRVHSVWWQAPFIRMMARNIGICEPTGSRDLDSIYVRQLCRWLDQSSLAGVVLLACDDVYQEDGMRRPDLSRLYVPNQYVLELAKQDRRFLPGISIHPARKDALELLDAGVESGAVLLKLLPCVQVVDPVRYRSFWKRMADHGLPLLAHTGGEFSLPTYRPDLCDPNCLRPALDEGVTVIAAHCGAPALLWARDYSSEFLDLRRQYPNLYGDVSALSQLPHLKALARLRENPERILFGSDYPVVNSVLWSQMPGWFSPEEARRLRRIRNPLERKYQLTRAVGFPDSIFTGVYDVLRSTEALTRIAQRSAAL